MPVACANFHPILSLLTATFSLQAQTRGISLRSYNQLSRLTLFAGSAFERALKYGKWQQIRKKNPELWKKMVRGLTLFAGSAPSRHRIAMKLTGNLGNIVLVAHANFHPNPSLLTATFSLTRANSWYLPTKLQAVKEANFVRRLSL